MPIDLDDIFSHGEKELIDLLDYGVRSVLPDLLFVFLVQEYRQHPTTPKAVVLYDVFCAPSAPARLSALEMLPPRNLQIELALRPLRLNLGQVDAARNSAAAAPPLFLPPKFLFDAIDLHLRQKSPGLRALRRRYRVQRTPLANLPGGKMNASQRHFVERVWEPTLRPWLVAAGFRRLMSIA